MRVLYVCVMALIVVVSIGVHASASVNSENALESDSIHFNVEGVSSNGREKRGILQDLREKWRKRRRGKHLKELDLSFSLDGGEEVHMKLGKVKTLTPDIKAYKISGGKMVEDVKEPSSMEYSLFQDASSGTSSTFLLACDDDGCNPSAVIYHNTEAYTLEPASSEPYLSKGRFSAGKEKAMDDERTLGVSKDGSSLGIPLTVRKRRDLALDRKMTESLLKRKRRQLNNLNNVVELAIIVDYSEYQYWYERADNDAASAKMAMELYFILLVNMMDLRFENLYEQTNDMDIKFMINAIIYAETEEDSPWIQSNIVESNGLILTDLDKALDDLTVWHWQNMADFPSHDHMLAVTKTNLATDKSGAWSGDVIGVAWTGGMCNPGYSVSLIEDPGIGLVDYAAAHELGHNLNSGHDGSSGCDDDEFFIMAKRGGSPAEGLSATGRESHSFEFSTCAVNSMHDFVTGLGSSNCMQISTYNQTQYDSYKAFYAPGVFLPVDTQCELQYGDGSRRCYALDSTICSDGAWCWNPDDPSYCYTLYVREGTLCGENLRCHKGACQNSSVVMTTCPPSPFDSAAAGGNQVVVVPNDVTAIPDQVLATSTPYLATAQTLLANSQASSQALPDTSEDLYC